MNLEKSLDVSLKPRYGTFVYVFDPGLDYEGNVTVFLEVNSTRQTDAYVVKDSSIYDLFIQGYPIYPEREFKHQSYFNTTFSAKKGYGVILFADPDWVFSDADISMKLRYGSQ